MLFSPRSVHCISVRNSDTDSTGNAGVRDSNLCAKVTGHCDAELSEPPNSESESSYRPTLHDEREAWRHPHRSGLEHLGRAEPCLSQEHGEATEGRALSKTAADQLGCPSADQIITTSRALLGNSIHCVW